MSKVNTWVPSAQEIAEIEREKAEIKAAGLARISQGIVTEKETARGWIRCKACRCIPKNCKCEGGAKL